MTDTDRKAKFDETVEQERKDHVSSTIVLVERYLSEDPDHVFAWLIYGESLYRVARYAEARFALGKALRLCPQGKCHFVYRRLGKLYWSKGSLARAARWYRKGVEENPASATDRIILGAVLARAGRLAEAEAVHREATRCKEGCVDEAYLNLGLVLSAQGRFHEARKCFRRAIALDPDYEEAKLELADTELAIKISSKP